MLSDIKGIKFKGAAFDSEATLKLFSDKNTERVCLTFGRNGSGKTTVTRAISKVAGNEEIEDIISAQFIDKQGTTASLSDDEKKAIFVFNEDYTNSKVRLRESGLGTIVMFGEVGDIDAKIKNAEKALEGANAKHCDQKDKYSKYCDYKNILSPEHHLELLKDALKGDGNWAGRDREITNTRRNTSVDDLTVSKIIKSVPSEAFQELQGSYRNELAKLRAAEAAGAKITADIPYIDDYTNDVQKISELLAVKIEEPILSEREQKLLDMAQSGNQARLAEIKQEFSSDTTICPFCLQDVRIDYKKELVNSVEKVLNKTVKEHEAELANSKIQPLSIELSAFEVIDKNAANACNKAIALVNAQIEEINNTIECKLNNLYTPIEDFTTDLQPQLNSLVAFLAELNVKKDEYNERYDNIPKIQNDLQTINTELAYYEIKDFYNGYKKQETEKEAEKRRLDELTLTLENAKNELSALKQQKKSIKIAVDFINKGLQYVFFSDDRLSVHLRGDNYMLKSNGKDVKPKNISAGERNILALCYFFTELLNNINEKDFYKSECLIVLDDPVSSFDLENRVGIISYIKSQIIKVLRGNPKSRIVLLSHDLLTIYDIEQAIGEVAEQIKVKIDGCEKKMTYQLIELDKKKIQDFEFNNRNEYTQLLKAIYGYASNASDEYELFIGNIMRRALEAFGTFEFRKGVAKLSCDPTVLSEIEEEKRDYFENLMYRLILNGESHLEDRTKSLTDSNFFATISSSEKKRTARDVLCLMFLLNSNHIKSHFNAIKGEIGKDAVSDIQQWIAEIKPTNGKEELNG